MSVYALDGVSVAIGGKTLVHDVSLSIAAGERVALIGESGSGKSLTCLAPFGLTPAALSGSARLDGEELFGLDPAALRLRRAEKVGFVFQQPLTALTPHLSVGQQLTEAACQAGGPRPDRTQLAAMLERVGLSRAAQQLDQFPHRLSGGERQRVMIAAAIAHGPRLLIADEPTSALDASLRQEIMALLGALCVERGMALLLVSHDIASIERHCDQLLVLKAGKVVESGRASSCMAKPAHEYTRRLVAATPRLSDPAPSLPPVGGELLKVDGLSVSFRSPGFRAKRLTAAQDIGFTLYRGEALALVGGSGSGKSTIGRALAGIGPMDQGTLLLNDQPLPPRGRRTLAQRAAIQPVFQDPVASLDPHWTVGQSIAEPMRALGLAMDRDVQERVDGALRTVGLDESFARRKPATLSGGQAQRAALARALSVGPDILVLDEATSALDPLVAQDIVEELRRLQLANGQALLFITHDLALAKSLCHRIAVLEVGRLVEIGPSDQITSDPQSAAAQKLVAAS